MLCTHKNLPHVTFFLPELQSLLKGTHFKSTEDICSRIVKLIKASKGCFGSWKAHMQWHVAYDGNYSEENNI